MRAWINLLSGLLVWTAHFFAVYAAGSVFPGTNLARWLTGALTVLALALVIYLGLRSRAETRDSDFGQWLRGLTLMGLALAGIAIVYQGLPGLITT